MAKAWRILYEVGESDAQENHTRNISKIIPITKKRSY